MTVASLGPLPSGIVPLDRNSIYLSRSHPLKSSAFGGYDSALSQWSSFHDVFRRYSVKTENRKSDLQF